MGLTTAILAGSMITRAVASHRRENTNRQAIDTQQQEAAAAREASIAYDQDQLAFQRQVLAQQERDRQAEFAFAREQYNAYIQAQQPYIQAGTQAQQALLGLLGGGPQQQPQPQFAPMPAQPPVFMPQPPPRRPHRTIRNVTPPAAAPVPPNPTVDPGNPAVHGAVAPSTPQARLLDLRNRYRVS